MKGTRRILSILIVLLLSLSLAGPAIAEEQQIDMTKDLVGDGKGVTLRFLLPWETLPKATLYEVLYQFFEETGISTEVTIVNAAGGWAGYFQKIQTLIAANDLPDLIYIAIEGFKLFQENELIIPIDDFIAESPEAQEVLKDIHPNTIAPYIVDGKHYAMPFEWNNVCAHINTNILEKAGLPMPPDDWTKDDLLEYARKMTYVNEDGEQVYGVAVADAYFELSAFYFCNNASFLNEDWTEATINSPEGKEIIQYMHDLIYIEEVAPRPGINVTNMFMNDLIGIYFAGRWPMKSYAESGFEAYDVAYVPKFKTQKVVLGGGIHPILASSQHKKEAFDLSVFLARGEIQMKALEVSSIPSSIKAMDAMVATGKPKNIKLFKDCADIAIPVESPGCYAELAQIFSRYRSLIFAGEMSVDEAMDAAADEMNEAIAAY
jgi:multiple sugar transport system substrate-binding protein